MSDVPSLEKIKERIYPLSKGTNSKASSVSAEPLSEHIKGVLSIIEEMEEPLFDITSDKTKIKSRRIDSFHNNLLRLSEEMVTQNPLSVAAFGLRIAAIVLNKKCNEKNAQRAMKIFFAYDEIVETKLEAFEYSFNASHKNNPNQNKVHSTGASVRRSDADQILDQWLQYEEMAAVHKLLALSSVQVGSDIASFLHKSAVNYLKEHAAYDSDFYHKIIVDCAPLFLKSNEFTAGLDIVEKSYRGLALRSEKFFENVSQEDREEKLQLLMYELVNLDTDILVAFCTSPSIRNMAINLCREHWEILKSINYNEALDFLDQIDQTCLNTPLNDHNREGLETVLDLTQRLRKKDQTGVFEGFIGPIRNFNLVQRLPFGLLAQ